MWATKKITRDIKYSYVDGDDKESLVPRRSSDDSKGESLPDGDHYDACAQNTTRHRSRWPYVTGNTTGIVALVLVYGLSIFAAVLGTCAVQNRGNNLLKKTSAYCKDASSFLLGILLIQWDSPRVRQSPHSSDQDQDRCDPLPGPGQPESHLPPATEPRG